MKLTSEEMNNSTLCAQLWRGVAIGTDGNANICCEIPDVLENTNIHNSNVVEFLNHDKLKDMRSQMLGGGKPRSCENCFKAEASGAPSLRQTINAQHFTNRSLFDTDEIVPELFELRTGNLCQLQCVMCHPSRTAKLHNFAEKIVNDKEMNGKFGMWIQPIADHKLYKWVDDPLMWDKLVPQFDTALRIFINGGEPLLAKQHKRVLERLISINRSKNVELVYSTNGLMLDAEYTELWKQFKNVNIAFSLDDLGERNHFVRYPSNWTNVVRSLDYAKQLMSENAFKINFNIWCAINFLSFAHLPEFIRFLKDNYPEFNVGWRSIDIPPYFDPCNLPAQMKREIGENILQELDKERDGHLASVINYIVNRSPNNQLLLDGLRYKEEYAKYRNIDLSKVFSNYDELCLLRNI